MTFRITYAVATGQFQKLLRDRYGDVAGIAQATMKEGGDLLKTRARQSIAQAGFSRKWQNALRVDVYPRRGNSINAAIYLFHKIRYASVFEYGETIHGKPYLWLPLPNTPKRVNRKPMNPFNFAKFFGANKLVSIRGVSKPLMGAELRLSKSNANKERPKVTVAALRRGKDGTGILKTVPLFVGVPTVRINKKFKVEAAAQSVRDDLASIYISEARSRNAT